MHLTSQVRKRATPLRVFGLFIFISILVTGIAYGVQLRRAATQYAATATEWSLIARPVTDQDHTIGDLSAPVQIIVYSSIACPWCRKFFEDQVPQLRAAFGEQIVIAYRHNPVPSVPQAQIQEPASECVYQQGGNDAFWRFVNTLFPVARDPGATDIGFLRDIAADAGVSAADFVACMSAGAGIPRVEQDKQEAAVGGLTVDPSFLLKSAHRALVIKGDRYSQIYASIQYLIEVEVQARTQE